MLFNTETNAISFTNVDRDTNGTVDGLNRYKIEAMIGGVFDRLMVFGTSSQTGDGFNLDAISVAAVPVPASAALMLTGLGAFGAMRRRKTS